MALFVNTIVLPDDPNGMGVWLLQHFYEHEQFVQLGLLQTPIIYIPDYPLLSWSDDPAILKQWLNVHEQVHERLRSWTGVQGVDLSTVDLDDDVSFFEWMDAHAQEHSLIRQVLGIS